MEQSDEVVMANVQRGQLQKLSVLYDRYNKRIYNYFLKCTLDADESGDLTQNVFIRVMKYRSSYQLGNNVEVWLFQIARNLLKDHFKRMKIMGGLLEYKEVIPDIISEQNDNEERERKLYYAMQKLPEDKRELLVMSKFQGLKYEQIAEIRSLSVSAVKVQVHRTINLLRNIYFEQENKE